MDVVITCDKRFLLCRRAEQPALGQWWLPGGRVRFGESIRDACVRKCREEVGLNVTPGEIVSVEESVFDDPPVHTINTVIRAELLDSPDTLRLDSTQSEHAWMSLVPADLHACVSNPLRKLGFPAAAGAQC
ncbi:NUDIX hydrolase [Microbacterium sp.]|uniref:NUDIX hydrolase n=1 Tax=Microbacterium sp. TaxID=51671 RepID=UPI0027376492|nr:NUDIX domain-containing protein [Microbacterium sp.]MDP3949879.1 NUDIX domain-containing protein [Microbacterium sp.]